MFESLPTTFKRAIGMIVKVFSGTSTFESVATISYEELAQRIELSLSVLTTIRKGIDDIINRSPDRKERRMGADMLIVINVSQYLLIAHYDLLTLLETMNGLAYSWRLRLHARHFLLAVYEILDDLPKLLGREFRESVSQISSDSELLEEIGICRKEFAKISNNYSVQLKGIRQNIAAHRDLNANAQLQWVKKLDLELIQRLSEDIYNAFSRMTDVFNRLHQEVVARMDSFLDEK